MTKEILKSKIAGLRSKAFPLNQPVNGELYRELKSAQDELSAIEAKEREDEFHQRYTAEIVEQKRKDEILTEASKHEVYRSF